jgi:hypothetical protein
MGERLRRALDYWAAPLLVLGLAAAVVWLYGRLWGRW